MAEADFRQLIEQAPEAISVFDGKRLCYANAEAVRLLGFGSAEEVAAQPWDALVHPDDRSILQERAQQMASTGSGLDPVAYRLLRKDGSPVLVEVSSSPVTWAGQPAILSIGRDVSARKALEAKQAQTQRLASLGTMLAGIAHELNNPLTYVLLALEHVRERLDAQIPAEVSGSLEEVASGLGRIETLVRRLREFSREDTRVPGPVSLQEVWSAVGRLTTHLRRHVRLVEEIESVAPVMGSAQRFQQVLINLLTFAMQRLPEGRPDNEVRVVMRNLDAQHVFIELSDNGAPVPAGQLAKIFDPFVAVGPFAPRAHTTVPSFTQGLSLAICHEIVAEAGGTIALDSENGSRTTFRITLPSAAVAEPPVPSEPPPGAPQRLRRHRLLIVDDEPMIGDLLRRVLTRDFEVEVLTSGRDALNRLREPAPPEVILCDVMMPELSGLDVYRAAVQRDTSLGSRFVFMTGGSIHADLSSFLKESGRPCVEKPFDLAHLVKTVAVVARQAAEV